MTTGQGGIRMRKGLKFDVMKDSPYRIMFCVMLPLVISTFVSMFTSPIGTKLVSQYVGDIYFTSVGLVSTVLTAFQQVVGAIISAAWIKTAYILKGRDQQRAQGTFWNTVYAILGVELILAILLLVLADPIFVLIHIPAEIYAQVKLYYCVFIVVYTLSAFSSFITTLVHGFCSSAGIFVIHILSLVVGLVCSAVFLRILPRSVINPSLTGIVSTGIMLAVSIFLLCRSGLKLRLGKTQCKPDWKLIWDIIRYGFVIALQILFCSAGYLLVTVQTNKYLPLEYISVLSISLPIVGPMTHFTTACSVFIPPNYASGNSQRVKSFVKIAQTGCTIYSCLCFVFYALLGEWYYGTLFTDPQIVAYGKEFWFWQGLGYIGMSALCVMRTVYDSVGLGKLSLVCGICEFTSNLLCAFWLIPSYGTIGRTLSYPLGWWMAALFLLFSYPFLRKRIYSPAHRTAQTA